MSTLTPITCKAQLQEYCARNPIHQYWGALDSTGITGLADQYICDLLAPEAVASYTEFDDKLPKDFAVQARQTFRDVQVYLLGRLGGNMSQDFHKFHYDICEAEIVTEDNYWVFREVIRANFGEYKVPNFMRTLKNMGVFKGGYVLHFPHVSLEDPTMVAYTPSFEYGKRDRQVRIKVGKYLHKYYGDILPEETIRKLANEAKGYTLHWVTTAAEMCHVYEHGPSSCMSGGWSVISGNHSPIECYEGEFRLAYFQDASEHIIARCLVHEPTKTWVRSYGDEGTALSEAVVAAGYVHSNSWEGAHLTYVEDDDGHVVLPYLDGDRKGVRKVGNKWQVVSGNYDYWCDNTDGVMDVDRAACGCCGERCNEDDLSWSDSEQQSIGPCCIDSYRWAYIGRHGSRDWVHEEDAVYNNSDEEYYSNSYAERVGLIPDNNGDYWNAEDVVETVDGEYACTDNAVCVGETSYGDPAYVCHSYRIEIDELIIDPHERVCWYKEYMPESITEAMEEQTYVTDNYVTDNYGVSVPATYFTLHELVAAYGREEAVQIVRRVGFDYYEAIRAVDKVNEAYTAIKVAA